MIIVIKETVMTAQSHNRQDTGSLPLADRPAPSRKWLWTAGIVAVIAAAGAAIVIERPGLIAEAPHPAAAAAPAPTPVSVAIVEQHDTAIWSAFSGRLEAVGRVEIRPRAAGAILAANFREGSLVKQGDLLFTIDPAPYVAEVQRLEAQLAAAQARLVLAAREQQRGFQLGGTNDLAQNLVDQRVNEYRSAEANLRSTQAQLDTTRLNLGYTEVRAPISGRVGKIEVTPGNLVPAGPTAPVLTTLVSVDPIYASFEADERSVERALSSLPPSNDPSRPIGLIPVQMGTLTDDGTPLTGKLQLIDNVVDPRSGTVRVRAVFDNADGRLFPGQFARLRLGQAKTEPAIAINEGAIGTDQDRRFVMVVGADNKAAYRPVQLGATADGLRIITAGLQPGERIVVNGLQRIRPGATVAPEVVAMKSTELASSAH
jgi:multidrug efflux system membrane fusion protein